MSEKILTQEIGKADKLIISAQHELDSAKSNKAPQGTIKHLEKRVKALESRKTRFVKARSKLIKQEITGEQQEDTKTAATPSGKKGEDKKDGDK